MSDEHPLIVRYIKKFEAALDTHDVRDAREIAAELKSHFAEALASGKPLEATLESLGPADSLARAYAVELHLNRNRETNLMIRVLKVASILAASSCLTLFATVSLGLMSFALVLTGVIGLIFTPIEQIVDVPYVEVGVDPWLAIGISLGCLVLGAGLGWAFWLYL